MSLLLVPQELSQVFLLILPVPVIISPDPSCTIINPNSRCPPFLVLVQHVIISPDLGCPIITDVPILSPGPKCPHCSSWSWPSDHYRYPYYSSRSQMSSLLSVLILAVPSLQMSPMRTQHVLIVLPDPSYSINSPDPRCPVLISWSNMSPLCLLIPNVLIQSWP